MRYLHFILINEVKFINQRDFVIAQEKKSRLVLYHQVTIRINKTVH